MSDLVDESGMEALVIGWSMEQVLSEVTLPNGSSTAVKKDIILAWCLGVDSERLTLRIDGFQQEMAIRLGVYKSKSGAIMNELDRKFPHPAWSMKESSSVVKRRPMFFYSCGEPYLVFRTATHSIAREVGDWLRSGDAFSEPNTEGVRFDASGDEVLLHEQFMQRMDLWSQGWYSLPNATLVPERDRRTRQGYGNEYSTHYKNVKKSDATRSVHPWIFAYDLEVNSTDGISFPEASIIGDYVGIASIVVWRYGLYATTRKEYLLVRGRVKSIEGVELICVNTEEELLDEFNRILGEVCPVVVTHFNGDSFDTYYLEERNHRLVRKWSLIGAHKFTPTRAEDLWPSMGGRFRRGKMLIAPGVCNVDMMKYAIENIKSRSYSLDAISQKILKRGKVEIGEYTAIFDAFREWDERGKFMYDSFIEKCREEGKDESIIGDLLIQFDKDREPTLLDKITEYGMEDSRLTAELFDNQLGFDGLIEMAQASEVTCDKYSSKGRMKRTMAMFYKMARRISPVVQPMTGRRLRPQIPNSGGFVAKPVIGKYDYIVTFDYNSLYPSIMASMNVCFTSILSQVASKMPFEDLQKYFPDIKSPEDLRTIKCEQPDATYYYKIVKCAQAVLPNIVVDLLRRRNEAKNKMGEAEAERDKSKKLMDEAGGDEEKYKFHKANYELYESRFKLFNAKQLAVKVTANSVYGFFNSPGDDAMPEGGMIVTALGRMLIKWVRNQSLLLDDVDIIYGDTDSVMLHFKGCKSYPECHERGKVMLEKLNSMLAWIETDDEGELYVIPEDKRAGIKPKILKLTLEKITRGGFVTGKGYFMVYTDLKKPEVPFFRTKTGELELKVTGLPSVKRDRALGFGRVYDRIGYALMDGQGLKRANEVVWEEGISILFDMTKKKLSSFSWDKFAYSGRIGKVYEDDSNTAMARLYHRMVRENTPLALGVRFDYYYAMKPKGTALGDRFITSDELEKNRKRRKQGEDIEPLVVDRRLCYEKGFVNVIDTMVAALSKNEAEVYGARQYDRKMERILEKVYLAKGRTLIEVLATDPNPCIAIGCAEDRSIPQMVEKLATEQGPLCLITPHPAHDFVRFIAHRDRVLSVIRAMRIDNE